MKMDKKFEFLEHTADVYVAVYGNDLKEAFENAALALFETMTDTSKIEPKVEEEVEVEAEDEKALLYTWLQELLIKFDITGNIYSNFKIKDIEKTSKGLKLKGKAYGEPFNMEKHPQKVGVKSITYHRMEIEKKPNKVTLRFILDV
jgi:SHS2 domain-containing protein